MRFVTTILLGLSLLLCACSQARPSDTQIRGLVAASHGALGDDAHAEIREFRRIDGRSDGGGRYTAEVEFDLVYLVSSEELVVALGQKMSEQIEASDGEPPGLHGQLGMMGGALGLMALKLNPFDAGDVRHRKETVTLERWETGWRLADTPKR